jgi:hypothetical protein
MLTSRDREKCFPNVFVIARVNEQIRPGLKFFLKLIEIAQPERRFDLKRTERIMFEVRQRHAYEDGTACGMDGQLSIVE